MSDETFAIIDEGGELRLKFARPQLMPPAVSGNPWELADDWTVFYNGVTYQLPKGFETDGASIPRFLWRVCGTPLESPRIFAALLHDYLYSGNVPGVTRAEADAVYRDMLTTLGVSKFKANVEYYALRLFGGSHWIDGDDF